MHPLYIANLDLGRVIRSSGRLQAFTAAVERARAVSLLGHRGPYTVFAPTNAAFRRLVPGVRRRLARDPFALRSLVLGHVVPGRAETDGAEGLGWFTTCNGRRLGCDLPRGVVGRARISESGLTARNGTVHLIDEVLWLGPSRGRSTEGDEADSGPELGRAPGRAWKPERKILRVIGSRS